jgi:hypothetical protein
MANQYRLNNCSSSSTIPTGTKLCLPPSCGRTYKILATDAECYSIESNLTNQVSAGDTLRYNPWVGYECSNLQSSSQVYGSIICLGPQNGHNNGSIAVNDTTTPITSDGYSYDFIAPPAGATVPSGTTKNCGKWHVAAVAETCTAICVLEKIPAGLFLQVNTALGTSFDGCTANLVLGNAYCVGPNYDWSSPYISLPQTPGSTVTYTFTDLPSGVLTSQVASTTT